MNVITIPRKFIQRGEFIIIPKQEYKEFVQWKRAFRFPVVKPTRAELRAIERGRREIHEGKYVEWSKLKQELARRRR